MLIEELRQFDTVTIDGLNMTFPIRETITQKTDIKNLSFYQSGEVNISYVDMLYKIIGTDIEPGVIIEVKDRFIWLGTTPESITEEDIFFSVKDGKLFAEHDTLIELLSGRNYSIDDPEAFFHFVKPFLKKGFETNEPISGVADEIFFSLHKDCFLNGGNPIMLIKDELEEFEGSGLYESLYNEAFLNMEFYLESLPVEEIIKVYLNEIRDNIPTNEKDIIDELKEFDILDNASQIIQEAKEIKAINQEVKDLIESINNINIDALRNLMTSLSEIKTLMSNDSLIEAITVIVSTMIDLYDTHLSRTP